ncbi:MAG: hypothetical protein AAGA71_11440 [Pseudomonadota bacterium]
MEVLGRDSTREAYRVAIGGAEARIVGLIPDAVISTQITLTGGRGHQTAYDWLARHQNQIETTLRALATGTGRIRAPFDRVVLEKDA